MIKYKNTSSHIPSHVPLSTVNIDAIVSVIILVVTKDMAQYKMKRLRSNVIRAKSAINGANVKMRPRDWKGVKRSMVALKIFFIAATRKTIAGIPPLPVGRHSRCIPVAKIPYAKNATKMNSVLKARTGTPASKKN